MTRRLYFATPPCPTPTKRVYRTAAFADGAAALARATYAPAMAAYRCRCGWWHLTSHQRQEQTA